MVAFCIQILGVMVSFMALIGKKICIIFVFCHVRNTFTYYKWLRRWSFCIKFVLVTMQQNFNDAYEGTSLDDADEKNLFIFEKPAI